MCIMLTIVIGGRIMIQCIDYTCPNRNHTTGYCKITGCSKIINNSVKMYNNDTITFPQTIGDITYYSRKELEDWVIAQQKLIKSAYIKQKYFGG